MSNYAVIEVGSSQERVVVGDKITVNSAFNVEKITPILVSPRKGQLITDSAELKKFEVQLSLVKEIKSKKIDIFQYKNKTGNRRRLGYRENQKILEVTGINGFNSSEEE